MKDSLGHGRSPGAFIRHWWLIAVPEKEVNNAFDYPVGLMYLLFFGPFLFLTARSLYLRKVAVGALFCVFYWLLWWTGSQQSRFLIVPLVGVLILTTAALAKKYSRIFLACVLFALVMTAVSVVRENRPDFGKSFTEVLRGRDIMLLEKAKDPLLKKPVLVDKPDAAFAPFLVDVRSSSDIFVINK